MSRRQSLIWALIFLHPLAVLPVLLAIAWLTRPLLIGFFILLSWLTPALFVLGLTMLGSVGLARHVLSRGLILVCCFQESRRGSRVSVAELLVLLLAELAGLVVPTILMPIVVWSVVSLLVHRQPW